MKKETIMYHNKKPITVGDIIHFLNNVYDSYELSVIGVDNVMIYVDDTNRKVVIGESNLGEYNKLSDFIFKYNEDIINGGNDEGNI